MTVWVRITSASVIMMMSLTACVPHQPAQIDSSVDGDARPLTAVVTALDINPVLTLPATVESGVRVDLTATVAGTFRITADGFPQIVDGADQIYPVEVGEGHVLELLLADGDAVAVGLPIVRVEIPGFTLSAGIAGADLLRFVSNPTGAKAQITGSGAPFDCLLVDPVPSLSDSGDQRVVGCRVPSDQPVIVGLTGVIAVRFPGKESVPALPIEAVAGTVSNAKVFIESEGTTSEVLVQLGVTDGVNVEIASGLDLGQVVQLPSPSLLGP